MPRSSDDDAVPVVLILREISAPRNLHSRGIFICATDYPLWSTTRSRHRHRCGATPAISYTRWSHIRWSAPVLSRITVGAPETGRIDFSLSFSSADRVACFAYALTVTSRIPGSSLPRGSRSCDRAVSDYTTRNPTAHFRIGRSTGNDERSGYHLHAYSRPIELNARHRYTEIIAYDAAMSSISF